MRCLRRTCRAPLRPVCVRGVGGQVVASKNLAKTVKEIGVAARGLRRCTAELRAIVTPEWGAEEVARQPQRPALTATGVRGSCSDVFGLRDE
eukprot:39349-Eustigmatos_ZCMA.PRE.1